MITLTILSCLISLASPLDSVVVRSDRSIEANEEYDNVIVLEGRLTFYGKAENLVLMGGSATLESGSEVGSLVLIRGSVEQKEGAVVNDLKGKGDYALFDFWSWTRVQMNKFKDFIRSTFDCEWGVARSLAANFIFYLALVITALIFLSIPGIGEQTSLQVKVSPLGCLGIGILFSLSFIPAALIFVFSIVGILFLPFLALAYIGFFWLGFFVFARAFGELMLFPLKLKSNAVWLLVGLIILLLLYQIPGAAFWVFSISSLVGTGAMLRGLFSRRVYFVSR